MSKRVYGQYCGMARALELVGERWALLIIRDLLIGPKRFGDLQRGLPGIPTNILTTRLKELEEGGIVQRSVLPRPAGGVTYELTESGRGLEDATIAIGRWGAKRLGDRRPNETVTVDSIAAALRTSFRPENARGVNATFVVKVGEIHVTARVKRGAIDVQRGAAEDADLVIEPASSMRPLLAREVTPAEALARGIVTINGDESLFEPFASIFRI